jgi:hypothetical protein
MLQPLSHEGKPLMYQTLWHIQTAYFQQEHSLLLFQVSRLPKWQLLEPLYRAEFPISVND